MRKPLFSVTALALVAACSARAADLAIPVKAQPPMYSWTGCYIGIHGGGGALQHTLSNEEWGGGALAGGQMGCNYQFEQIVIGIEGEGWWSTLRSTFDDSATVFVPPAGFFLDDTIKNRWDFDATLRVGFAWNRALIYGKAGAAWGRFNMTTTSVTGGTTLTEVANATFPGLLLAVGGEYAFAPNWSAKLEYDFIDYFSRSISFTVIPPTSTLSLSESATKQIVKIGLNYKLTP
jgi:outer membrane immunogenic protein